MKDALRRWLAHRPGTAEIVWLVGAVLGFYLVVVLVSVWLSVAGNRLAGILILLIVTVAYFAIAVTIGALGRRSASSATGRPIRKRRVVRGRRRIELGQQDRHADAYPRPESANGREDGSARGLATDARAGHRSRVKPTRQMDCPQFSHSP